MTDLMKATQASRNFLTGCITYIGFGLGDKNSTTTKDYKGCKQ